MRGEQPDISRNPKQCPWYGGNNMRVYMVEWIAKSTDDPVNICSTNARTAMANPSGPEKKITCPKCSSDKVNCWLIESSRRHCTFGIGIYEDVCIHPYDSIHDDGEEYIEGNTDTVNPDCDACQHQWQYPRPETWFYA